MNTKNSVLSDILYFSRKLHRCLATTDDVICGDCKKRICESGEECVIDILCHVFNDYCDALEYFLKDAFIKKFGDENDEEN